MGANRTPLAGKSCRTTRSAEIAKKKRFVFYVFYVFFAARACALCFNNVDEAKKNLAFFLDAGFIADPDSKISALIQQTDTVPVLGVLWASRSNQAFLAAVQASSYLSTTVPPENAIDQDVDTSWTATGISEWIQVDYSEPVTVAGIRMFHKPTAEDIGQVKEAILTFSDGSQQRITFRDLEGWQSIRFEPVQTLFVKLEVTEIFPTTSESFSIFEMEYLDPFATVLW